MNRFAFRQTRLNWAWTYLVIAILAEVLGLTIMRMAMDRGSMLGHLMLYLLIGLSYVLLSKAVREISVGVAYAIWEGTGIALITLVSWLVFAHELSIREMLGLALAVVGIVLVNAGHVPAPATSRALTAQKDD